MGSGSASVVCRGLLLLAVLLPFQAAAFYLPGLSPKNYEKGEAIDLKYNKVFSDKTHLPFEYSKLPVCVLEKEVRMLENIGEVLRGDRISKSPIEIRMHENIECKIICSKIDIKEKDSLRLQQLIKNDYEVEWIIENLPGATPYKSVKDQQKLYQPGFRLGVISEDKAYLHNHFHIVLRYHDAPEEYPGSRIVGFEVHPVSVENRENRCPSALDGSLPKQEVGKETSVVYSYSVSFVEEKDVDWADRWNLYLAGTDIHIHWYSIINSLMISLVLSAAVAFVMLRTLKRDITLYNQDDLKEDQEVTGWKLVYGDVFRSPRYPALLSALVGSGLQLIVMAFVTILFALIGVLNPSYRGGMASFATFLFVSLGAFGGYHSARLNKTLKGGSWQKNALLTGSLAPAVLFLVFFLLNLFIWSQQSSSAVPFGTFVAIVVLWFCVSLPLVLFGAYFGQKKQNIEYPVRINHIPRQIPELPWYLLPQTCIPIASLIPFAVIFIELSFIMTSIWQDQFYYLYGFLAIIFLLLVVSCVEITIVMIYFQLCAEDYRWWWRSFFIPSSSALYIFIYATFYYVNGLEIVHFVPGLIYFTYVFMASFVYFLCTGTIGFLSCFYFLRSIYSAVKID